MRFLFSRTLRIRHIYFKFWTYYYLALSSDPENIKYVMALPIYGDHILRLFRAYEAAMASTTIQAPWRQIGFEYENRNMTTYLSISEGQIRESRDFREIWMFNYHENHLLARRQKQKWGWINEHKFWKKERTLLRAEGVSDLIPEFRISSMLLSRSRTWDVREWATRWKISTSCQRPLLI
jgi:hypothetical protein